MKKFHWGVVKKVAPYNTSIDNTKDKSSSTSIEPSKFDEVWALYNYKQGKKKARTAWKRLSKKNQDLVFEAIPKYLTYLQHPKNHWRDQMLFTTFLNGEHWESDWSVEVVDNSISALIEGEQLSPDSFDKFSAYVDWVKEKQPGVYASIKLLTAKEYFSYAPNGSKFNALRQVLSPRQIRSLVTNAHTEASIQIAAGKDVESVGAILSILTQKVFA